MESKTRSFDPAFACASESGHQEGLTKREYFAAMAMQAQIMYFGGQDQGDRVAKNAVIYADALIQALNAEVKGGG